MNFHFQQGFLIDERCTRNVLQFIFVCSENLVNRHQVGGISISLGRTAESMADQIIFRTNHIASVVRTQCKYGDIEQLDAIMLHISLTAPWDMGVFYFLLKVAHFYRASHFFKWSSVKVLTQNVAFAIWLMTGHCILMNKRNSLSEGCFLAFFSKAFENRSPPTTFYKFNEISRIPYRFTISTQGPPHLASFNAIQTLGST